MEQNGSFPGGAAGSGQAAAAVSLSVYAADPASTRDVPSGVPSAASGSAAQVSGAGYRAGLTGALALQGAESLTQDEAGTVLSRLDHLIRWAQAQQAKTLTRMQILFRDEYLKDTGTLDPGLAFSLAAEEAAAILHVPTNTAMMLMSEAGTLCTTHTATLRTLESGGISYGHAQTVVDQSQSIPSGELPGFETQLLALAPEQTHTQFRVRARRLRENTYPETIAVRQRSAFDRRRVALQPACDGMSWLSTLLPADKAQTFFHQLSLAARGEQAAGDPRTVDQLRADIMESLLHGHQDADDGGGNGDGDHRTREDAREAGDNREARNAGNIFGDTVGGENSGAGGHRRKDKTGGPDCSGGRRKGRTDSRDRARARTEILVLISAETLFGADEQPAELHGYGPISPVTARRMAREAAKWTPVERDLETEDILRVGRKRKVPDGLKQLLRVRDGTCRFPGCRTNAVISEIDHTMPWAQGGATDHDNLEHLCRRHHMFKTKGFWKACQPSPGIIEWTSPGGRKYRTEPHLILAAGGPGEAAGGSGAAGGPGAAAGLGAVGEAGGVGAVGEAGGVGAAAGLGAVGAAAGLGAVGEAGGLGSVGPVSAADQPDPATSAATDPDDYGDDPPPF